MQEQAPAGPAHFVLVNLLDYAYHAFWKPPFQVPSSMCCSLPACSLLFLDPSCLGSLSPSVLLGPCATVRGVGSAVWRPRLSHNDPATNTAGICSSLPSPHPRKQAGAAMLYPSPERSGHPTSASGVLLGQSPCFAAAAGPCWRAPGCCTPRPGNTALVLSTSGPLTGVQAHVGLCPARAGVRARSNGLSTPFLCADASAVTAEQGPAGGGDEDGGAFHADAHDQGDVASPQLVIRLEPRFALGAGAGEELFTAGSYREQACPPANRNPSA